MRGSLKIARVAGINIAVHWTFLFLIAYIVVMTYYQGGDLSNILWSILFILTIFVCVILHELGHSLTGQRFGVSTPNITLLPIGGMANMQNIPDNPKHEFLIAVAGPAVNVVIAALLYLIFQENITAAYEKMMQFVQEGQQAGQISEEAQQYVSISGASFLFYLFTVNVFLVLFNAIPAFPMDGGRVFRSLLSFWLNRVKATQIASVTGQILAVGFALLGIFVTGNPFLVVIAVVVFMGARGEYSMVKKNYYLKGHSVREALRTRFTTLKPYDTLQDAENELLAGSDQDFIVMDDDENSKGVLTRNALMEALGNRRRDTEVHKVANADIPVIQIDQDISEVYDQMMKSGFSLLPVVDGERFVGVLDFENVSEFLMLQRVTRNS